MDGVSTIAAQPQWRFDQLPAPGDSALLARSDYSAFFGQRSLVPTEDDASSSSGSDLSDQFEASSQASYSTDITEPDHEASDDLPGTTRFIESISFGHSATGPCARQRQDVAATAAVHSKLAALDGYDAHSARVPIGCHRAALSRVDSVCSTQSQRYPVLRCATGSAVTQRRGSAEIKAASVHPRRTAAAAAANSCSAPSLPQNGTFCGEHPRRSALSNSWSPPSLVREEDRRKVMVEQLVETASQLIAAIWPASVALPGATQGSVISLPFFVRETLRRSRTSYNSLQVALYYIVKLRAKGKMPFCDASKEQNQETQALRAMQCGRRMLLTSLILASKYLQDRNFSARAWSKISGLPVNEITSNEMAVLQALDWKLHVTESDFSHWSVVVHKSTEVIKSKGDCRPLWQQVIKLHHDGASVEALALAMRPMQPVQCPVQWQPSLHSLPSPSPSVSSGSPRSVDSFPIFDAQRTGFAQSMLATPTCSPPREPSIYMGGPPPPAPHLGTNLSTPSLTPLGSTSSQASTPAAFIGLNGSEGFNKTGSAILTNSAWSEFRMLSPQSLNYGSDDDTATKASAGSKRRASQTGSESELTKSSSPLKVCRRA